jgi:lipoprotein-anchoring transpeptidase ErfK/SrfK
MLRAAKALLSLGLLAFAFPPAVHAQVIVSMETGRLLATDGLRPGQYRWTADAAPAAGPVTIVVSLALQRAWVFRGGVLVGVSTISSGQPGWDTPTGRFTILEKQVTHRSSLYEDAPMPFMQRLTLDGIALHAGRVAAEPVSHGCIRLPRAFAQALYGITRLGTAVLVTDEAPGTPEEALALAETWRRRNSRSGIASAIAR